MPVPKRRGEAKPPSLRIIAIPSLRLLLLLLHPRQPVGEATSSTIGEGLLTLSLSHASDMPVSKATPRSSQPCSTLTPFLPFLFSVLGRERECAASSGGHTAQQTKSSQEKVTAKKTPQSTRRAPSLRRGGLLLLLLQVGLDSVVRVQHETADPAPRVVLLLRTGTRTSRVGVAAPAPAVAAVAAATAI